MSDPTLSRRQLLTAGVIAGGYALAVRPAGAAAITTDTEGLATGTVKIPVKDGEIPAYLARPVQSEPAPLVLVVHEIFGVHEYVQDVCRRLANAGYAAVAPDFYQRQGNVLEMSNVQEIIGSVVAKVPDAQVMADLDATVAWARASAEIDASRRAITGFCWGGRVVWLYAAHDPELDAGVAWYGRLEGDKRPETPTQPLDLAQKISAPVLGLYGGQDRGIPMQSIEKMKAGIPADCKIVVFPDAGHGFHADYRASYDEKAATEGWNLLLDWLRNHGV